MQIHARPEELLETLRWRPEDGFFLLERHLARLARAAVYFGLLLPDVREALAGSVATFPREACRVRLIVPLRGAPRVEAVALRDVPLANPLRVALAREPIEAGDPGLRFKTSNRAIYARARAGCPGVDDVLLHNTRGELTESTIANLVVERAGRRVTPPLSCGVLAGVYREELLARGEIVEAVILKDELTPEAPLFLINSVREWMPARLVAGG